MKTKTTGAVLFFIISLFLFNCDVEKIIDDATTQDITVEKSVYTGTVTGSSQTISIANNQNVGGEAYQDGAIGKTLDTGFIELPVPVPDVALMSLLIATGNWHFEGQVRNDVANATTFGLYFSTETGLAVPHSAQFNAATSFIASITIPASETISLNDLSLYDQSEVEVITNLIAFFMSVDPSQSVVYLYIVCDADNEVKLTVLTLNFVLPPSVQVTRTVAPGDLTQYGDKIQDVKNGSLTGQITNMGADSVSFSGSASLIEPGFISGAPADADLVGLVVMPGIGTANNIINLADTPSFLVPGGAERLNQSVLSLIAGDSLEINFFLVNIESLNPIQINLQDLGVKSTATVSL